MTMAYDLHQFPHRDALYDALSDALSSVLAAALAGGKPAGFIVPGGRTPAPLFQRLSSAPLAWTDIWLTLTDERWVAPGHEASNEGMVRRTLLQNAAQGAHFVPLYHDDGDAGPAQAASLCHGRLQSFPWDNTICLLGMGDDGHIASLFPHNPGLKPAIDPESSRLCCMQTPTPLPPAAPYPRLTLTLAALLRTQRIYLLLTGPEKLETLARADAGDDVYAMPVRGVLQPTTPRAQVYWAP